MIEGEMKASELSRFANRFDTKKKWDVGESVLAEGWNSEMRLELVLRAGSVATLADGNRRISYISKNGGGGMMIPVSIIVK